MIDIKGLAQGADYTIEFPFTLDGIKVNAAAAIEFEITKNDTPVLTKTLGNGVTIQSGLISVQLTNANTLALVGYYDFELWIVPVTDPSKRHFIGDGRIHFSKTNSRI